MNTEDVENIIFDHVTSSWGIDSNHDLRRVANVTLQWSICAEALNHSTHKKGAHAMLASFRDLTGNISIHHNLFCSSRDRHPTLGSGEKTKPGMIIDYRNNVVYNLSGATNLGDAHINFINNYYRPGPDTREGNHPLATKVGSEDKLKVFLTGNIFEENSAATKDNYLAITFDRWGEPGYRHMSMARIRADHEFDVNGAKPLTESATEAYERVLQSAGASLHRDAADERLVKGVRDRTNRLIDTTDQVGGWPTLKSVRPRSIPTAMACRMTGNAATVSTPTIRTTATATATATASRISKSISTVSYRNNRPRRSAAAQSPRGTLSPPENDVAIGRPIAQDGKSEVPLHDRALGNGDWSVRHVSPNLGTVQVAARSQEEAFEKMRGELRYRLEICPCTGELYQDVQIEISHQAGG